MDQKFNGGNIKGGHLTPLLFIRSNRQLKIGTN